MSTHRAALVISPVGTTRIGAAPAAPYQENDAWWQFATAASAAGVVVGAYHGYKRNDSIGWAIAWAALGGLFPLVTIPIAFAQGVGERKR